MLQVAILNKTINDVYNNVEIADCERFIDASQSDQPFYSSINSFTANDAISLLTADHDYLTSLVSAYQSSADITEKLLLTIEICTELLLHRQVEEEIFYPAAKLALMNDGYLIDEPIIEHNGLIALIADVENNQQDCLYFQAKMQVLVDYVNYHVKHEREYVFPQVRLTGIDLKALGQKMASRKLALMHEHNTFTHDKNALSANLKALTLKSDLSSSSVLSSRTTGLM